MQGIIKNRKGWIEIVEVFITVFLLTGVLFVVIENSNPKEKIITPLIYEKEIAMLREVELNDTLRADMLSVTLPVEWDGFSSNLPRVKDKISSMTPTNLECVAKLCELNDICTSDELTQGSIYVKSLVISADLTNYSPRQLKLFCREKV